MVFLNSLPIWCIFIILMGFLPICIGIGYALANYCSHLVGDYAISDTIPGSLLGINALLIGFTFSMAVDRFEQRRDLLVQEANSIGTTYLRTQTLPAQQAKESQKLIYQYLAKKVEFGKTDDLHPDLNPQVKEMERIQGELWKLAQSTLKQNRGPVEALYLNSLNETIDLHTTRIQAIENQLPPPVLALLLSSLGFALVSLGFVEAIKKRKTLFWLITLTMMFTTVIALVLDLDRPRRGFIQIDQAPMEKLYHQVRAEVEDQK